VFGYATPNKGTVIRQKRAAKGTEGRILIIFTEAPD
jgi:hypothetical protein